MNQKLSKRGTTISPKGGMSPQNFEDSIEVGGGNVVLIAKKTHTKKKIIQQSVLGPCIYSPRFDAVEVKRDKGI